MSAKAGIPPWDATRRRREPGCGLERCEDRWLDKVVARQLDTSARADRFRAKLPAFPARAQKFPATSVGNLSSNDGIRRCFRDGLSQKRAVSTKFRAFFPTTREFWPSRECEISIYGKPPRRRPSETGHARKHASIPAARLRAETRTSHRSLYSAPSPYSSSRRFFLLMNAEWTGASGRMRPSAPHSAIRLNGIVGRSAIRCNSARKSETMPRSLVSTAAASE
jgi:hypothetical protein